DSVTFQYSNVKCEIAKILVNEGYINGYEILNNDLNKRLIKLSLKYDKFGKPVIENIRRVSKPSKRIYTKKKDIYKVLNGFGTLILSTSVGILSGKEARLKNVGGEVIGEVY
ncbi:MAG: 30S ribosomal protein S8, partial [Candidatus Margulisiibacteriota bacterium]